MLISDYIEQAGGNLRKKKLRTFLTTFGVVIGIGALVSMFAFGQGVQRNVTEQFNKLDLFNYVNVYARGGPRRPGPHHDPDDGGWPPQDGGPADANAPQLDSRFMEEVTKISGVEAAFPELRFPAQIRLGDREQFTLIQVLSGSICRSGPMALRAGRCYDANEPNGLIISDSLLQRLNVRDPPTALGRQIEIATLTLDFSLASLLRMVLLPGGQSLPIARESYRFSIVGVAERMPFGGMSDVYIAPEAAGRMRKLSMTSIWDFFRPTGEAANYPSVTVKVRSVKDVAPVKKELESRGFRTWALMDQLGQMRIGFLIMDMFLIAIGMIGVTVASLGIVNTMVMSILERYREIGIMKAVGATDGDVQRIFLFESGTIGLLGGLFGLTLAWIVSMVINTIVNVIMTRQGAPYMSYFCFPWWLCLGAIVFSILISLAAGILPTRRAARVDPVVALRHD
ncbi:MAG: ABC transporter permease [Sedimentisphaerales bacterium]|nr:ABC transporter permease [Sedimentisphaerales bacterium]